MRPSDPADAPAVSGPRRVRLLRLVGWIAAANAVAIAFASMPVGAEAAGGARALLAFCGIG